MEWISVEDGLPEKKKEVLINTDFGRTVGHYCGKLKDENLWFFKDHAYYISADKLRVLHWMPFPEPPKEE